MKMKEKIQLPYSVFILVILFISFAGVVSSKLSLWKTIFVGTESYVPKNRLVEQSENFRGLVDCVSDFVASNCFQRYRKAILEDYKLLFGIESNVESLDNCFEWVAKEKWAHLIILSTAECILQFSNDEAQQVTNKRGYWAFSKIQRISITATIAFLVVTSVTYFNIGVDKMENDDDISRGNSNQEKDPHDDDDDPHTQAPITEDKDLDIPHVQFDLTTSDDGLFERRCFNEEGSQDASLNQEEHIAVNNVRERDVNDSVVKNKNEQNENNIPGLPKEFQLRKARTDVNINDPTKPIPSVLSHPTTDKRGNPLKRIFIPGRGWISTKALQLERESLLQNLNLAKAPPINY